MIYWLVVFSIYHRLCVMQPLHIRVMMMNIVLLFIGVITCVHVLYVALE